MDKDQGMRKTSFALPEELWRAIHIRALDEHVSMQDVIIRAVEQYFKAPRKGGK